ncbi:MAG: alpha/beta hydrolase [Fimbriimonadaceae bacterium]
MITTIVALLAMQTAAEGRFDQAVRLIRLDDVWVQTSDPGRRAAAVPEISSAVMAFFANRTGDASRSLDMARAALASTEPSPTDAITLIPWPRLLDANETAYVVARRTYGNGAFSVNGVSVSDAVSEPIPVTLREDGTAAVALKVGDQETTQNVRFFVAPNVDERIKAIDHGATQRTAAYLREVRGAPISAYAPTDDRRFLETAEKVAASTTPRDRLLLPIADHQSVIFRLAVPDPLPPGPVTVVIALHGAGGNEHMFMDSLGRGLGAKEAMRRGWIFASPQSRPNAPAAIVDWLRTVAGVDVGRVFVMGHSAGGAASLQAPAMDPPVSAIALFAPAAPSIPDRYAETPIFLAVGAQEMPMLRTMSQRLGSGFKDQPYREFKEYENSEHLMIVADALSDAFRFFDRVAAR